MSNCYTGAFPRNSENDSVTLWSLAPSQRRLLRSGWALCSCRDTWLPQVPWYWDCAFNCCQSCDSQVGPHICCLWCSWIRENLQRSLLQWAWVRTICWLSWFCIPKVTPLWPKANGEVESFMRSFGKVLHTTTNWKQQMYQFLHNYRVTPHSNTGLA